MKFDFTPYLGKATACCDCESATWTLISVLALERLGKSSVSEVLDGYATLLKEKIPSLTMDVSTQSDIAVAIENLLMSLKTEKDSTIYLIRSLDSYVSEEKVSETNP